MKNYLLIFLVIMAYSCSDDDDKKDIMSDNLRTPQISEIVENGSSFTGALVIYPCDITTSAYFGNYTSLPNQLKVFPATYLFGKSNYIKATPPILLPLGEFTLMYWGVPYSNTPTYSKPASNEPSLTFGRIMKDAVISLRPTSNGSNVCYPTFDYVFGRQDIYIGREDMTANLTRVAGGIIIDMSNSSSEPFDSAIDNIYVEIGEVAKSVNFYTGVPSDFTAFVRIPLTISADRMYASNDTAMLFPSGETTPSITINIQLVTGTIKSHTRALTNSIDAGNILTIDVSAGAILTTPEGGGFDVDDWTETKESISI